MGRRLECHTELRTLAPAAYLTQLDFVSIQACFVRACPI
jgi:hypothetical protein